MTMTKQDRAERIRMLAKLAIGILRRNDAGGYLDIPGKGRVRALDCRCGEFRLSFRRRVDDEERLARLKIKFAGETVLSAAWTDEGFVRTSYRPSEWEGALQRVDRMPAMGRE
ncbi:hypothetical protein IVA78_02585 [Bradyrhizobium sp. 137]|uniref:hypothetical protein n=1 Tax=Bradyrhizobium sp. 137 TaxID=2782614 RepID=UPI001FFAE6E3|nr:hypothetical protein [Bradyrhizobium sp. 137]MCK1754130.1 hypothetical protein [Bradyrhizobium sp. 137]